MATNSNIMQGIPDEALAELTEHWQSRGVQAFRYCLECRAAWETRQMLSRPVSDEKDARQDWRYRIGSINALEFAAGLPAEAAKKIEERIKR